MGTKKGKTRILSTVKELILAGKSEEQLTMRYIASEANVNLALINYYFRSKENLLSEVVGSLMQEIVHSCMMELPEETDPEGRLRRILNATANAAFKHQNICIIAISNEMKSGCINSCNIVLEPLSELFPDLEFADIKILALQLMLPFHHLLLNSQEYGHFLETDFNIKNEREKKIKHMIDLFINPFPRRSTNG